ncbi:MAG: Serine acetyltransferase [Lentisphaerae bacterium ADurb.Bin242]|nr:MAG: Serine acetyltransferase [Lentisphaerae bacterium ADurb.Bin242]
MSNHLNDAVDAILESYERHPHIRKIDEKQLLNRTLILGVLRRLQFIIFPGFFDRKELKADNIRFYVGQVLGEIREILLEQIEKALRTKEEYRDVTESAVRAHTAGIVDAFLTAIPKIREYLATDLEAAYEGDPAAFSREEVIFSYPGIYATMVSRIAHELYRLGVPLIPRIMTEHAHSVTGIDIHPGASLGKYFFIDHGTGIVIGETSRIGDHVKIYQGVTLGALSTRGGQILKGRKRHPTIEDNVTIYSGASILGGETVIREGVVIGGNSFVTRSVPEQTRVSAKMPELQFKRNNNVEFQGGEFWNYEI